jgi:hypothetical protein
MNVYKDIVSDISESYSHFKNWKDFYKGEDTEISLTNCIVAGKVEITHKLPKEIIEHVKKSGYKIKKEENGIIFLHKTVKPNHNNYLTHHFPENIEIDTKNGILSYAISFEKLKSTLYRSKRKVSHGSRQAKSIPIGMPKALLNPAFYLINDLHKKTEEAMISSISDFFTEQMR